MLTDAEIAALMAEPKEAISQRDLINELRQEESHRRVSREIRGDGGSAFRLSIRQNVIDPQNFSVILSVVLDGGTVINLRRHNGPTHSHSNPIEGTSFRGAFHVHEATERYQERGFDAEHYAEPSQEFADLGTALAKLLADANFHPDPQPPLFLPNP